MPNNIQSVQIEDEQMQSMDDVDRMDEADRRHAMVYEQLDDKMKQDIENELAQVMQRQMNQFAQMHDDELKQCSKADGTESIKESIKESQMWKVIELYLSNRHMNETKIFSFNKFVQQTLPRIVRNLAPIIVKHGQDSAVWHRFKFLDVVINKPIHMNTDGQCRMLVPQECLRNGMGYCGDVFVHIEYTVYNMVCTDGSYKFVSRAEERKQHQANLEASAKEGISHINNLVNHQKRLQSKGHKANTHNTSSVQQNDMIDDDSKTGTNNSNGNGTNSGGSSASNRNNDDYHNAPPKVNLAPSDEELIAKYGVIASQNVYKYVRWIELPVMLKSCLDNMVDVGGVNYGECLFDDGGNFITNSGVEKVLMFRERIVYNEVLVFHKKESNFSFWAECRSDHTDQNRSTSTAQMKFMNKASASVEGSPILMHFSQLLDNIPLVIMLRALGLETADDIRNMFWFVVGPNKLDHPFYHDVLERCIEDHRGCLTTHDAICRLGKLVGGKDAREQTVAGLKKMRKEVLPHLGYEDTDFENKALYLCYMAQQLMDAVEESTKVKNVKENKYLTNKDSYFSKRMEMPDDLFANLVRQYLFHNLNAFVKRAIRKKLDRKNGFNIYEVFDMEKVSRGINYNVAMGNWRAMPGKKSQTGVSQNMDRYNFVATMSQHRKIINHIHKDGRQIDPRLLENTAYGTVDAVDSPDGDQCGLVRHEALFSHCSMGTDPDVACDMLTEEGGVVPLNRIDRAAMVKQMREEKMLREQCKPIVQKTSNSTTTSSSSKKHKKSAGKSKQKQANNNQQHQQPTGQKTNEPVEDRIEYVLVFVNEVPIGIRQTHKQVIDFVRTKRRAYTLSPEVSVSRGDHDIVTHVRTEPARFLRPMYVVENLWKLNYMDLDYCSWDDLMLENVIELIDVREQAEILIASTHEKLNKSIQDWFATHGPDVPYPASKETGTYSHAELHGCIIYGIAAQLIPFSDHNQSVRNTFQCGQGKQAQGAHSTNAKQRMDTSMSEMWYVERPLVSTRIHDMLGFFRLPAGQNLEVAIMAAQNNEEDSVVINSAIVDAGYLCSSVYKTYLYQEKRYGKGDNVEKFGRFPREQCANYKDTCDYSKLDENGIIRLGSVVHSDTILVQKVIPRTRMKKTAKALVNSAKQKIKKELKKEQASEQKQQQQEQIEQMKARILDPTDISTLMDEKPISGQNKNDIVQPGDQLQEEESSSDESEEEDEELAMDEEADSQILYIDCSVCNKSIEGGVVDKIHRYINEVTGVQVVKIRLRNPRIPQEADKYCLTPDHQVLTKQGWKQFSQLTMQDDIATLDDDRQDLVYSKPTGLYEFDHDGDTLQVLSDQVDLQVTMNHKMFVQPSIDRENNKTSAFELVQARQLVNQTVNYKNDAIQRSNDDDVYVHGFQTQEKMDKFIASLGQWISNNHDKHENIAPEFMDYLTLSDLIRLPQWCFQLSMRQAQLLIQSMDSSNEKITGQVHCLSKEMAGDLQRLALHAGGWAATVIGDKTVQFTINDNSSRLTVGPHNNQVVQYKGKVFCVEVPSHVFYVRRNGKAVWTGNSSRHGQKGTAGKYYPKHQMPYCAETGQIPDLLYNGLAFISRMTFGQKIETLYGIVCALNGHYGDATPFSKNYRAALYRSIEDRLQYAQENGEIIDDLADALRALGYSPRGSISMISGITGKRLKGLIFSGPTNIQKLKHMVIEKVRGRGRGKNAFQTKQPTEGRAMDGGLKVGEMEKDVLVGHGASALCQDKLFVSADPSYVHTCEECHQEVIYHEDADMTYCLNCNTKNTATNNFIPATTTMFAKELRAICLDMQFNTKKLTTTT